MDGRDGRKGEEVDGIQEDKKAEGWSRYLKKGWIVGSKGSEEQEEEKGKGGGRYRTGNMIPKNRIAELGS